MDAKMKSTFGGVLLGVIMLLVAFNISGQTVDVNSFGLYDDLQPQESSSTNVEYVNGSAAIADTFTSATYTSVNYTVENVTELQTYTSQLNENNSITVTVTGYDDTGTETGTASETISSDGMHELDVSSLGDSTEQLEIEYQLDRDSTSDASPQVDAFEGFEEGETPYLNYVVAIFGIAVMLFSLRGL